MMKRPFFRTLRCDRPAPGARPFHGGDVCEKDRKPVRVTLIEGQGTGPTVCTAVRKIIDAADVPVQWDRHALHLRRDQVTGMLTINEDAVRSAEETGVVLRGPEPGAALNRPGGSSALALNKALNAFVGVRLFASVSGHEPFGRVRLVNIRENVSGEYSEIEHTAVPGVVQSIKTTTRKDIEKVAKFAFDYAAANGHHRVTALHKANVMRLSDGMFLRWCRAMSGSYPDVEYAEEKLDTFCLRVVSDPGRYDVLLTPSLYGAFASAACSTLAGGAATVPSAAYGPNAAVFSTMGDDGTCTRDGSDPCAFHEHDVLDTQSSKDPFAKAANPTGLIRSAVWMLGHLGLDGPAQRIGAALHDVFRLGIRTRDMGGTATCDQIADAVVRCLIDNNTADLKRSMSRPRKSK